MSDKGTSGGTTYRMTPVRRLGNAVVGVMVRVGVGPVHLLTTRGRKTGEPRTTPVTPVEVDGTTYLVAPYGAVDWVRNARAAGRVTLRRGRHRVEYAVHEVTAGESGPVLKEYLSVAGVTQPWFTARPGSPVEDFVAEADRHPVFALSPAA